MFVLLKNIKVKIQESYPTVDLVPRQFGEGIRQLIWYLANLAKASDS